MSNITNIMKFSLRWLLLAGIFLTKSKGENLECVKSENCSCLKINNTELIYKCSKNNFMVNLSILPVDKININCSGQIPQNPKLDILPNINLEDAKYLTIEFCAIAQDEFKSVLEKFKITNLKSLYLHDNELNTLNKETFAGLTQLKHVGLNNNKITKIEEDTFEELSDLGSVDLRSNDLHLVPSNIFKHNTGLGFVNLMNNPNLVLSDYVFANLPNLQIVSINNCNLKVLPPNTFKGSVNLFEIRLRNNSIENLPENVFENLTELNGLHLDENKIKSLPSNVFSWLTNLQLLNLTGNEIEEINENSLNGLSNLGILRLNKNKIKRISSNAFVELKGVFGLDLSHNMFDLSNEEGLSPFRFCEQLDILLLHHNEIKEFPENIVNTNGYLAALDLSYNKIGYINVSSLIKKSKYSLRIDVENNNVSLVGFEYVIEGLQLNNYNISENIPPAVLYLSNNPIACDCSNLDLIRYLSSDLDHLKIKKLLDIDVEELYCASPESLKNTLIKELKPEEVVCSR